MVAQIMPNGLNLMHCKKLRVEGGGRIHSKAFGKRRSLGFIFAKQKSRSTGKSVAAVPFLTDSSGELSHLLVGMSLFSFERTVDKMRIYVSLYMCVYIFDG